MSTLDTSKTLMYEFCCIYVKAEYEKYAELCYVDTDSFVLYIKN